MRHASYASVLIASSLTLFGCGSVTTNPTDGPAAIDAPAAIDGSIDSAPVMHTVTVTVGGNGVGAVTSSPGNLNCPGTCTIQVADGAQVVLTATPSGASVFMGWSGGCSGSTPCTLTVTGDVSVGATFALNYTLMVTVAGTATGVVTSTPTGINCGSDCMEVYSAGTTVTLSAAPGANATFTGWSGGGCSGAGNCVVTINAATSVTATFDTAQFPITVTRTGTGTVTSNVGGINCGATCMGNVNAGATVVLTESPGGGQQFTGWGGACSAAGTNSTCTLTVNAATTVTANFAPITYTLTVTRQGGGTGTVSGGPINCGGTCMGSVNAGTVVTLTEAPASGSVFAGWNGGGCSGTGTTCTVTVNAMTTVTATFNLAPNIVFITSTTHTGALGGLAGADNICQTRATAAGLAGTYRAWLSSSTVDAISRLGSASGWVRPDGLPVANTQADLANGRLMYLPTESETGADLGDQVMATATSATGTRMGPYCADWTVADTTTTVNGSSRTSSQGWTNNYSTGACNTPRHLYCFGVDRAAVATAAPGSYRRVFMTNGTFSPSTGIAGADTLCGNEATAAGLAGSYRALLATTTATAASRFSSGAGTLPWARVDNVPVAPTAAGFFSAATWTVAPSLSANGQSTYQYWGTWNGAATMNTVGSTNTTCADWTNTAGNATSGVSDSVNVSFAWGGFASSGCGSGFRLICMQL